MRVNRTRLVATAVGAVVLALLTEGGAMAAPAWNGSALRGAPGGGTRDESGFSDQERRNVSVYRTVSPSVVSVVNTARVRDQFSLQAYDIPRGAGSGFIWDRLGHVVTNYHVVVDASSLKVTLHDGTSFNAQLVGVDPDHDVAVLRIRAPDGVLVPIPLGTSRTLLVGQAVLAIGNPFGLDTSLSVGIVSALGRTIKSRNDRPINGVIQTDAAINPGNSGGPLLDSSGRLVGMNTAIYSNTGSYAGIGFAVPADIVHRVVPQLIATGKVRRAGMGVVLVPDHIMDRTGVEGVGILRVAPRGAAARAGMQGVRQTANGNLVLGDILVDVDGSPVKSNDDLYTVMDKHLPGDTVNVTHVRSGKRQTSAVTLQALE